MRRRFYAILMILMSQASFAADDLVVTVNFFKTSFGGHIHLSLFKVQENNLSTGFMMNIWSPGYPKPAFNVLQEEQDVHRRKAFRFSGDFKELTQKWRNQWLTKINRNKLNFWYNNCADDVLDTMAFIFGINPGLRKFWRVARFVLPLVNIFPAIPEATFHDVSRTLKYHPDFMKLSKLEMQQLSLKSKQNGCIK